MTSKKNEPQYLDANGRPIKERPKGQLSDSTAKKIADVLHLMLNEKR